MAIRLSKSRIMAAKQCPKRLWLDVHRPDLRTPDENSQRRLDQGRRLHEVFRGIYPNGELLGDHLPLQQALQRTEQYIADGQTHPLFEATFNADGVLVRADMLRGRFDGVHLTEVKSSTRVKAHHLVDCAIRYWLVRQAGHPIAGMAVAHVDRRFVYAGDGNYSGLLRHVDVTDKLDELLPQVPEWIETGLVALASDDEPRVGTGPHCNSPFACPFIAYCSPPETEYPLKILHGGGRIVSQLRSQGINDVRDIPTGVLHKPLHERIRRASISGTPYLDPAAAGHLRPMPFPRYHLDFESVQFAVPRWPCTRPYEQLPFQWSCHKQTGTDAIEHLDFLDTSGEPPMRACAESLIDALGDHGPVFVYSRFEGAVLGKLAARFDDLSAPLQAIRERMVDLLPIVRRHYYHPAMKGSFSIKAVLPTVAPGLDYKALGGVKHGTAVQSTYEAIVDSQAENPADAAVRGRLANELRAYCRLDTLAMLKLVQFLEHAATAPHHSDSAPYPP